MAAVEMAGQEQVINLGILGDLSSDPIKLHEWLVTNRLIPSERMCFKCNSPMSLLGNSNGLGLFRCFAAHARGGMVQEPASSGTWFQESTFPSDIVLVLTYCFARKYVYETAATEASLKLKLPDKTIADWYTLCRQVCMASLENHNEGKIGGPGVTVEVDQYKIGRLKYKRGCLVQGAWLLGMLAQDGGVRFVVYPESRRNIQTLLLLIQKYVEPGTVIVSNCWRLFDGLTLEDIQELAAQHSYTFREPKVEEDIGDLENLAVSSSSSDDLTCKIESQWHAVRQILVDKGVRRRELAPYLCEYIWRRNAKSRGDVFSAFLQDIAKLYPLN